MTGSVWTRATEQPPSREALTRPQIVRAAIVLLDEEGLAGLSMRKLGTRLSVAAPTLYWHVQTKDDLLEYVLDEVYAEIDVPEPDLAGWRNGAMLMAHSLRATILRHRWLPAVLNDRVSLGPNAMALSSRGMALFRAAGFTGRDVENATSAVVAYVLGSAGAEASWRTLVQRSGRSVDDWSRETLDEALPVAADYPDVSEVLRRRGATDPYAFLEDTFVFGLKSLLDGFAARLS